MRLIYYVALFVPAIVSDSPLIKLACERNPSLPYCARTQKDAPLYESTEDIENRFHVRHRARSTEFDNQFEVGREGFVPQDSEEIVTLAPVRETTTYRPRRYRSTTPLPRQNILYTLFPTLQKDHSPGHYCPNNKYTFQVTCLPQKKLRYDLMVFCQEFADICGVPNVHLYPSKTGRGTVEDARPAGYGQKQKNGNFGIGRSFAFGTGVIPGFAVVSSQGADIGHENLPFFNQIGGMILNNGVEIGATGKRIGMGPARTLDALDRGFPTGNALFGQGDPTAADRRATGEFLRSFGIPNVAGLGKILKGLNPPRPHRQRSRGIGYEPGYGALNKKAPLAFGKVDHDSVNLPGGLGDFEVNKGSGFGIGKK